MDLLIAIPTGAWVAVAVLLVAFGFIGVHLLVQREEPAGMDHAVREAVRAGGRWLLGAHSRPARHRSTTRKGASRA